MEQIELVIKTFFNGVWGFFTGVTVPGFGVKLSTVAIGFLLVRLSIIAISVVTGFRSSSVGASESYRTSRETLNGYKAEMHRRNNPIGFDR